jgi:hypothetical protein
LGACFVEFFEVSLSFAALAVWHVAIAIAVAYLKSGSADQSSGPQTFKKQQTELSTNASKLLVDYLVQCHRLNSLSNFRANPLV